MRQHDMSQGKVNKCVLSRITLDIHQRLTGDAIGLIRDLGINLTCIESARSVRQRLASSWFGLPAFRTELIDNPMDIIRILVCREDASSLLTQFVNFLKLGKPGRGSVLAQNVESLSPRTIPSVVSVQNKAGPDQCSVLEELSLITAILSKTGSGEHLARIALKLGAGVPFVNLVTGTGIRDRIGLLRITIPPEKELVNLVVPAHDAEGLERLLIDEGNLDRPGGGFVYRTSAFAGVVDTLISIGRQHQAASIEQIIAAIDDLKKSTSWRKRFTSIEFDDSPINRRPTQYSEISFVANPEQIDCLVNAAINAGASGATTSRVSLQALQDVEAPNMPRTRGLLCVPTSREKSVLNALTNERDQDDPCWTLQVLPADGVFFHRRG